MRMIFDCTYLAESGLVFVGNINKSGATDSSRQLVERLGRGSGLSGSLLDLSGGSSGGLVARIGLGCGRGSHRSLLLCMHE